MAYALLIIETPGEREVRSEALGRERYDRMVRFSGDGESRLFVRQTSTAAAEPPGLARLPVSD